MRSGMQTYEFTLERVIPAPVDEVFDSWLDPGIPGKPWHDADKLIFDPKVDGLFYVLMQVPHYGRFIRIDRPDAIQHTFVSPNTRGLESLVTVTFQRKGEDTLMRLRHEGLPDDEGGRGHERGWTFFLGLLVEHFSRRRRSGGS
ncbi:MAG TPA: SRPBCC domain-containing protein [Spirochaetia bacterium]|nr:SRPBCC domain-containing protein [Spirochaetia bacterium]